MANRYLEKIALRRVVSELAKGNITKMVGGNPGTYGQIARSLQEAGAIKSPKVYAEGGKRGIKNVLKELGPKIWVTKGKKGSLREYVGTNMTPTHKGVNINMPPSKSGLSANLSGFRNAKAQRIMEDNDGIFHEAFEAMAARKAIQKGDINYAATHPFSKGLRMNNLAESTPVRPTKIKRYVDSMSIMPHLRGAIVNRGESVGSHASLGVLGRESELIRKNPYKSITGIFRDHSGEADYVSKVVGKRFGIDKFTGKDIRKLENTPGNAIVKGYSHPVHDVSLPPKK